MDILLIILGVIALLLGLVGCIVPMLPGPPIAYVALLMLQLTEPAPFTTTQLLLWLLLVAFVQLTDYLLPMLGTKYSGGGRWGSRGCLVGTLLGLFFMPWGLLVGPFLGAYLGTLIEGRNQSEALKSGFGSLLGFLLGTVLKCLVCGYFAWQFVVSLF
ncbi:MAG: DUF456 domain-containing protein [Bacteroides sp.]